MIKQCSIIFGCLALGELIVKMTHLPIPGSLIGMVLLICLLEFKVIQVNDIKEICNFLIKNMAFFFVPAGVGVILYLDVIQADFWSIMGICLITTIVVLLTVGLVFQRTEKR